MDLQSKLEKLGQLPIFKMSLGSKELFHSNFMEFLWDIDNDKFIEMINSLPSEKKKSVVIKLKKGVVYTFNREKENFDICIHHSEPIKYKNGNEGEKEIYDLIIENKVKSIPRKDQLAEYENKAKKKGSPLFILLSLVTNFPCKSDSDIDRWIVADYCSLRKAIENAYKNIDKQYRQYVFDYCDFIRIMHELQEEMTRDFDNQVYYNKSDLKAYKKLRIHDLYLKLRGSLFITELKDWLIENIDSKYLDKDNIHIFPFTNEDTRKSFKYGDIRNYCENRSGVHVFLECTIQQGSGMVAAYVYKKRDWDYIYEFAIQSDQYRHGINSHEESDLNPDNLKGKSPEEKEEAKKLEGLWNAVYIHDSEFFDRILEQDSCSKQEYYKYAPEYVYKYVLLNNETAYSLLGAMTKDIKLIVEQLFQHQK